jgi:imidazolonepropionase-like amidohydrolase
MRWAKKHKVNLGFGTDAASLMVDTVLLEFEARSMYFTPYEMLVQATSNNGKLFALARTRNPYRDAPLGVIEVGAWADLLLYDGNPLEDINVVIDYKNTLDLIMKDGEIYKNDL